MLGRWSNVATFARWRRALVLRVGAAAASALVVSAFAPWAAAAATPILFEVELGDCYVTGTGPAQTAFVVTVRDSDGTLVTREELYTDETGRWEACFRGSGIEIGDVLTATVGSTSRRVTIPRLLASTNRVTDVVTGRGPASSRVGVTLTRCSAPLRCSTTPTRTLSTTTTGAFTTDYTSAYNTRGGDYATVTWRSSAGDRVHRIARFHQLTVFRAWHGFFGDANRGQVVTATLKTSAGVVRGTGRALGYDGTGFFDGAFRNADGDPAYVRAGDRVSADFASDAAFTVPNITVSARASTDVISGTCLPNRVVAVHAYGDGVYPAQSESWQYATASSTGSYSLDMSSGAFAGFDLTSGAFITAWCVTAAGDHIGREAVTP